MTTTKSVPNLEYLTQRLHRQQQLILESELEYKKEATQKFLDLARTSHVIPRAIILPNSDALVYCKSFTSILAFQSDALLIVLPEDTRDVQLSVHEVARHGQISSNVNQALAGAAVGLLVFGAIGPIVGAIAGSSAQRTTTEIVAEHEHTVDLYTRVEQIPVVSVVFGQDKVAAKEYYGIISAAVV